MQRERKWYGQICICIFIISRGLRSMRYHIAAVVKYVYDMKSVRGMEPGSSVHPPVLCYVYAGRVGRDARIPLVKF